MNVVPLRNFARVHPPRTSEQQIVSSGIFGLVLRPSLVGFKLEPCVVVTHVLFVDGESRGDSNCQFACFLFQVIELPFLSGRSAARYPNALSRHATNPSGFMSKSSFLWSVQRFGSTLYLRDISVSCDESRGCDVPASHGDCLGCAVALGAVCGTNCGTTRGAG